MFLIFTGDFYYLKMMLRINLRGHYRSGADIGAPCSLGWFLVVDGVRNLSCSCGIVSIGCCRLTFGLGGVGRLGCASG